MPFLQDNRPPIRAETLDRMRAELPREYGTKVVEEGGRRMLVARVPRAKPDYNYELAEVALYASLNDLKDVKDVIMIGDEKSVRMDPLRLRDHIREQIREDADVAGRARQTMPRSGDAWSVITSPGNLNHRALVIRLAVNALSDARSEHFQRAKAAISGALTDTLRDVQYACFVTDTDHGRVGRRIFVESLAPELAATVAVPGGHTANPLHLLHQTPGGLLKPNP